MIDIPTLQAHVLSYISCTIGLTIDYIGLGILQYGLKINNVMQTAQ